MPYVSQRQFLTATMQKLRYDSLSNFIASSLDSPMYRLSLLLFLLFIVGCETQSTSVSNDRGKRDTTPYVRGSSIQALIASAENANPTQADKLRLKAARIALENSNSQQADAILDTVGNSVEGQGSQAYYLLRAEVAILAGDGISALGWLKNPALSTNNMTKAETLAYSELKAQAYYVNRSYLASARERIFFDNLLDPEAKSENHEQIFSALMQIPYRNLNEQARKAITSDLRGWLSLASLTKRFQDDPIVQLQELNKWRRVWSSHPAAIQLPESLSTLSRVIENQPKSIALLLPLRGSLGPYGRAIRDSIMASRFQFSSKVAIQVFDTNNADITQLVNQAAAAGAELIIGPLDRTQVTTLAAERSLPVPILALNRTLDGSAHPDLYQFGLAPEDEMIQVAEQVFREGKRNALIIYPEGDWGSRNFETFNNHWLGLGGNVIDVSSYQDQKDYSTMIKTLLDVDQSEKRAEDLRRILGQRFEFTPRRRQDIDFVFLLGNQTQARGLNPTLAFYYAEDIPVYSTSHIYEDNDSRIESIDLNGIRFCDIPWKLTEGDLVQQQVEKLWPAASSRLAPFYALGHDAFRLYPRLQQLKELSRERLYGATGVLTLSPDNVIHRELMWAQYINGEVKAAPLIVGALDQQDD